MKELSQEIQTVIEALNGGFEGMPTTYKNCAILTVCIEKLVGVRDKLAGQEVEIEVGDENGNTDSE